MNRHCMGTFYILDGKERYRCLYNGRSIPSKKVKVAAGIVCPICDREIDAPRSAGEVEKRVRVVRVTEVLLPEIGWVEYLPGRGDDEQKGIVR